MRSLRRLALSALVLLLLVGRAHGEALFASPPHFLALRDREEIVFFINEPVAGALASRTRSGVEVIVPRALVDPTLRGTTFRGDDSATAAGTRVVLAPATRGNAAIRITTSSAPAAVHAYSERDPPRLVIDLLAAPQPTPTPAHKAVAPAAASAAREKPKQDAAQSASAVVAPPAVLAALAVSAPPAAPATQGSTTAPPAAPAQASTTASNAPPAPASRTAPEAPAAATGRTASAAAEPAVRVAPSTGAASSTGSADAASAHDGGSAQKRPCAWRRIGAVAFCAPDPEALAYATHADLAALARALAAAADPATLPQAIPGDEPGALYLAADRELVVRAAGGRLLPAIDLYRRALRRAPKFFDAPRARLNVALAYRVLGFDAELQSVAQEAAKDATRPIIDAVIGDLARERDAGEPARDAYARAMGGDALAVCLATRGRAALVLASDPPGNASAHVARLPELCPPEILADAETIRVQARQQLADGQPRRGLAMLEALRGAPEVPANGLVLADIAAAAAAAGDDATARARWTELASGHFGARLATRATLGLAQLDVASGDDSAGFRRLDMLGSAKASDERRRLANDALVRALRRGADAEAVAIVAEQSLAPALLASDDQIALARSYRAVGLASEADALLRALAAQLGKDAPDALWHERGRGALTTNPPQALAVADEWLRTRGAAAPADATALRARALAALGQATAAAQSVDAAVALDPAAARTLRLDVAVRLQTKDPGVALRLARAALGGDDRSPRLAAPDAAAALRVVAESAEATGEAAAALAAYRELADRYADQPAAEGAQYRLARLGAGDGGAAARAGYAEVARSRDALERRVATAAEAYEAIVKPFENRREAP